MNSSLYAGSTDVENAVAIESSFQRLLTAIETDRDQIKSTWEEIQEERDMTNSELLRLRRETEDWCKNEKAKIDKEWNRLDTLSERMRHFWPNSLEVLHINCSGQAFSLPRSTLCLLEDSKLAMMFSDGFINHIPKDPEGRLFLDFNPQCFSIIVDYLQNRRLRPDAPVPTVPAAHQQSMDLLAEALNLKPFMADNQVAPIHSTSLNVMGNMIQAMHPGWQLISAANPLSMAKASYFEVKILANPNTSGGLAIGICGHIPVRDEVHSIRLPDSVVYNSHNGLVGDCTEGDEDVQKGVQLKQGDTFGVRYEVAKHGIIWYYNSRPIGASIFKKDCVDKMKNIYPVFALYAPDTRIEVDFKASIPDSGAG